MLLNAVHTSSFADMRPDQDMNVRGASGETAMHALATHNQLDNNADPFGTGGREHTRLRIAQEDNDTDVVRFLIHHNELVRALAARQDKTPDGDAAMDEDELAKFRRDVLERVEENSTNLVTAARNGDLDTVRRIVEGHEITIDAVDGSTGETAFAAALAAKRTRVIKYLLAHGANVFAPCIVDGETQAALVTAVAYGDVSLIGRFAGYESLLDMPGLSRRVCPLAEAMKLGSIEMVKALLEIGLRPAAIGSGTGLPIFGTDGRIFYDMGTIVPIFQHPTFRNVPSEDESPWRLLEFAYWLQDTRLISQLYETFDVLSHRETMARLGGRALVAAVCRENEQLVTDLLDRGAPINGEWKHNAMAAAVLAKSVKMLRLLLSRGGDTTIRCPGFSFGAHTNHGLLANALNADAIDCAYELLPLETRPGFLDEAFTVACKRGWVEFVTALLDTALPPTSYTLELCITSTSCPLMLDLLLSRCDFGHLPLANLNGLVRSACFSQSAEVISVLLAHGNSDARDMFSLVMGVVHHNKHYSEQVTNLLLDEFGVDVAFAVEVLQ